MQACHYTSENWQIYYRVIKISKYYLSRKLLVAHIKIISLRGIKCSEFLCKWWHIFTMKFLIIDNSCSLYLNRVMRLTFVVHDSHHLSTQINIFAKDDTRRNKLSLFSHLVRVNILFKVVLVDSIRHFIFSRLKNNQFKSYIRWGSRFSYCILRDQINIFMQYC